MDHTGSSSSSANFDVLRSPPSPQESTESPRECLTTSHFSPLSPKVSSISSDNDDDLDSSDSEAIFYNSDSSSIIDSDEVDDAQSNSQ